MSYARNAMQCAPFIVPVEYKLQISMSQTQISGVEENENMITVALCIYTCKDIILKIKALKHQLVH